MSAFGFPPPNDPGLQPPKLAAISVMDPTYGATGNGADDTAAIAKAMTAASTAYANTGGIVDVWLPSGYEFFCGQLHALPGVRLRAEGAAIKPNLNNWAIQASAGMIFWTGTGILPDFGIIGGTWLGTGAEASGQFLFHIGANRGMQDCIFRDMKITGWGTASLSELRNPTRVRVINNVIIPGNQNNGTALNDEIAFQFDGGATASGKLIAVGNIIDGCIANGINLNAISPFAGGALRAIVADNIVNGTGAPGTSTNAGGISLDVSAAVPITDVHIHDNQISATSTQGTGYAMLIIDNGIAATPQRIKVHDNTINSSARGVVIGSAVTSADIGLNDNKIIAVGAPITGATAGVLQRGNRFATAAASQGRATLIAGTVTVNTAEIQAGDNVLLTVVSAGGTRGEVQLGTIVAGTSFVINSIQPGTASTLQTADICTVFWQIVH